MDRAWIRDALAEQGYSQRDLAKQWGISEASVTRFIAGTEDQDPKMRKCVELAGMLGMSLDELAQRLGIKAIGAAGLVPIPTTGNGGPRIGTMTLTPSQRG